MNREHILSEIRRTAVENGGVGLGRARFQTETGIRESDWRGIHWVRWNEALAEAGLQPNQLQPAYPDDILLGRLAELVRELGHWPVVAEQKLKARRDKTFPNPKTLERFGGKGALARAVIEYCLKVGHFDDVVALCDRHASSARAWEPSQGVDAPKDTGAVYLLKAGRHFKIGRSNSVGRRERELAIQLPEKARLVHSIRTDDPVGIEAYWHGRFAAKRGNGEWFALSAQDVAAFRRRKFM